MPDGRSVSRRTFVAGSLGGALVVGCGGGALQTSDPKPPFGRATITIHWPHRDRSRLIPLLAESILVILQTATGTEVIRRTLNRPVGNTTTTSFSDLPVGRLLVRATAYPLANAQGVAQAEGNDGVEITKDQTATLTMTMATTIVRLDISPAQLNQNETVFLTASPRDSGGNLVLTPPNQLTFTLEEGASDVLWDAATARLTPLKLGSVRARATEGESGISSTRSWSVQPLQVGLKTFIQRHRDMVYDPLRHLLWLSVPSNGLNQPHAAVGIHPETGEVRHSHSLSFEPNLLALSSDSSTLLIGQQLQLDKYRAWGLDLETGQVGTTALGEASSVNWPTIALNALPGNSKSLAYTDAFTITLFDNGVARGSQAVSTTGFYAPTIIRPDGQALFTGRSTEIKRYRIDAAGLTETHALTLGGDGFILFSSTNALLLGSSLDLRSAETLEVVRTLEQPFPGTTLSKYQILDHVADPSADRNYLLVNARPDSTSYAYHNTAPTLLSYETSTGRLLGTYSLPSPSIGGPFWSLPYGLPDKFFYEMRLVVVAPGRLFFRTKDSRLYRVQIPLPNFPSSQGSLTGEVR